jgi:2-isopropylmalate synthase
MKDPALYEHIEPETVGNIRRVLISDLSGKSNIDYKARELGFNIDTSSDGKSRDIAKWVKDMEYNGYQFDGAEASFELVLQEQLGGYKSHFDLVDIDVHIHSGQDAQPRAVATLKVEVDGQTEHTAAEGVGPVHAMDVALRKALVRFFPSVAQVQLVDYKVRVLDEASGTSSKVRVLITSSDGQRVWSTVGASENIIEASWLALRDSLNYHLYRSEMNPAPKLEEL